METRRIFCWNIRILGWKCVNAISHFLVGTQTKLDCILRCIIMCKLVPLVVQLHGGMVDYELDCPYMDPPWFNFSVLYVLTFQVSKLIFRSYKCIVKGGNIAVCPNRIKPLVCPILSFVFPLFLVHGQPSAQHMKTCTATCCSLYQY